MDSISGMKLKKGTYLFEFMAKNKLTGTFTIENCKESILLIPCQYLEGLYIKDTPNLVFENDMFGAYSNLKSLYIDNVQTFADESSFSKENILLIKSCLYFYKMKNLNRLQIKNCGGTILEISLADCPKLETFICENNTFSKEHYGNSNKAGGTQIRIYNCENLKDIQCKDNKYIWNVDVFSCFKLNDVNISNVIAQSQHNYTRITNCSIDNLIYDPVCYVYYNDYGVLNLGFGYDLINNSNLSIRNIHANNAVIECNGSITSLKTIYANECSFSEGDFSNYSDLETVEIRGRGTLKMNFNGCRNLKEFTVYDTRGEIIDIRNCPNLRYANCSNNSYLTDILFDNNINRMNIICRNNVKLLKMIPDFFQPTDDSSFNYDVRYEYIDIRDKDNNLIRKDIIDHKYGWWYPGEPKSGYHGR